MLLSCCCRGGESVSQSSVVKHVVLPTTYLTLRCTGLLFSTDWLIDTQQSPKTKQRPITTVNKKEKRKRNKQKKNGCNSFFFLQHYNIGSIIITASQQSQFKLNLPFCPRSSSPVPDPFSPPPPPPRSSAPPLSMFYIDRSISFLLPFFFSFSYMSIIMIMIMIIIIMVIIAMWLYHRQNIKISIGLCVE